MTWNPINTVNLIVCAILVISEIAVRVFGTKDGRGPITWNGIENILFSASVLLMIVPLTLTHLEFGFPNAVSGVMWLIVSTAILIMTDICDLFFMFRGAGRISSMIHACAVSILFLMNGTLLRHPLLFLTGALLLTFRMRHVLEETEVYREDV